MIEKVLFNNFYHLAKSQIDRLIHVKKMKLLITQLETLNSLIGDCEPRTYKLWEFENYSSLLLHCP